MNAFFPAQALSGYIDNFDWNIFEFTQSKFKELHFSIRLPEGFNKVSEEGNAPSLQKPYIDAAYFKAGNGNAEVLVQVSAIEHEVSLLNYYLNFINEGKEQLLDYRLINDNQDQPDILSEMTFPDNQRWLTRKTGFKVWNGSGAFVVTINAACNATKYHEDAAHVILAIAQSLKPLYPVEYAFAEIQYLITRRYPLDFACYLPVSWHELHHHNNTMDYMNLSYIKKINGNPIGILFIQVKAVAQNETFETILSHFHKAYSERYTINNLHLHPTKRLKCFSEKVLEGCATLQPQEAEITAFNTINFYLTKYNSNWLYIEMFGHAKEENFEAWAVCDRALDLMKESFKVL